MRPDHQHHLSDGVGKEDKSENHNQLGLKLIGLQTIELKPMGVNPISLTQLGLKAIGLKLIELEPIGMKPIL